MERYACCFVCICVFHAYKCSLGYWIRCPEPHILLTTRHVLPVNRQVFVLVQTDVFFCVVQHFSTFVWISSRSSLGSGQGATATVFIMDVVSSTCYKADTHSLVYCSICCFLEGCVEWRNTLCELDLLSDPLYNTNVHYWLMWNFEVPQMVLVVIIHAQRSGFMTCK